MKLRAAITSSVRSVVIIAVALYVIWVLAVSKGGGASSPRSPFPICFFFFFLSDAKKFAKRHFSSSLSFVYSKTSLCRLVEPEPNPRVPVLVDVRLRPWWAGNGGVGQPSRPSRSVARSVPPGEGPPRQPARIGTVRFPGACPFATPPTTERHPPADTLIRHTHKPVANAARNDAKPRPAHDDRVSAFDISSGVHSRACAREPAPSACHPPVPPFHGVRRSNLHFSFYATSLYFFSFLSVTRSHHSIHTPRKKH